MDKILYCPAPFSTYTSHIVYTQESDEVMFQKHKDIIELTAKYHIPLTIKVHPHDEKGNLAHFKYLAKNYHNVKVIGGYWRRFRKAEHLVPKHQLIILDVIKTALITTMAKSDTPTILYTKRSDLIESLGLQGLRDIFHVVNNYNDLENLIYKFSFGELYPPKEHLLLQRWFKKRETIKNWFQTSVDYLIARQLYSKEFGGETHWDGAKIVKRLFRIKQPPRRR